MTKEHWISESILEELTVDGLPPLVSGLPWLAGAEKPIPAPALASRVLCGRHNGALSPLDKDAVALFRTLHKYQNDLAAELRSSNELLLVSGTRFELWLLKLLLGGVASGSFGHDGVPIAGLRAPATFENLVEVLFRGGTWPPDWGFYAFTKRIDPDAKRVGISVEPLVDASRELLGLRLDMGVVGLDLAFGTPSMSLAYRPGLIAMYKVRQGVEKLVAFAWKTDDHDSVVYETL
jgi:hypothetical protein